MNAREKFAWQLGDLRPGWMHLINEQICARLLRLLRAAPRSREEQANKMLTALPWPIDEADARARAVTVINYLTGGYRVGNRHPSTEEAQHERRQSSRACAADDS